MAHVPNATTFSSTQLDRATAAARRAISDQLASLGEKATVFNPNLSLSSTSPQPAFPPRQDKPWHAYRRRADTGPTSPARAAPVPAVGALR